MKKIILLTVGFLAGSLYSESGRSVGLQEKRGAVCSLCGRSLSGEDFLQGSLGGSQNERVCRFCLKKLRGKGNKGEKTEGAVVYRSASSSPLFAPGFDDGVRALEERMPGMVMLPRAGRRRHVVLLRDVRTGSERKNKHLFRDLMEEEAQVAREHTWTYRVLDGSTVEVENGIKKVRCFSKSPLTSLWYRGHCAVLASELGYKMYDFYSGETKKFASSERDKLKTYLERHGYGSDFKEYTFDQPVEKKEDDGLRAPKKSILASQEEREKRRQREQERERRGASRKTERLLFSDEALASGPLEQKSRKPHFYYATDEGRKTLLVGNDDGYILKWPVEETIIGLLARGTEAIITTQVGAEVKQLWHDFARHNEDKMVLGQDYPITVLELPVQPKEELIRQGFSESSVSERTFDQMFHDMAVIPEGFAQTVHPAYSLRELLGCLDFNEARSLSSENDEYRCLLDAKKAKIEVVVSQESGADDSDEEEDSFEIVVNNHKDRVWKRGSEVLIPDNDCFVLYNFKTEVVERFDVRKVSSLEDIEKELPGLRFSEIK